MISIRPDKTKALMLAQRELPTFVCEDLQLEGINFTIPEIMTLMDGITVGGHRLIEQQIAINQISAWRQLFAWVDQDQFAVTAEKAYALLNIVRNCYKLAEDNEFPVYFDPIVNDIDRFDDVCDRAIHVFLTMTKYKFFAHANRRIARLMMNGLLLSSGYPVLNFPVAYKTEFTKLMIDFEELNEPQFMSDFLRSCFDERIISIMNE